MSRKDVSSPTQDLQIEIDEAPTLDSEVLSPRSMRLRSDQQMPVLDKQESPQALSPKTRSSSRLTDKSTKSLKSDPSPTLKVISPKEIKKEIDEFPVDNVRIRKKQPYAHTRALPKDPNAPRQPKRPYDIFLGEKRSSYASSSLTFGEINSAIARDYRNLTESEKEKYNEMARRSKEEHDTAMIQYSQTASYAKFQEKLYAYKQMKKEAKSLSPQKKKKRDGVEVPQFESFCAETTRGKNEPHFKNFFSGQVFSKQFVDFNSARESYLRTLRRKISQLEHEETLLQKAMRSGEIATVENLMEKDRTALSELSEQTETVTASIKKALKEAGIDFLKNKNDPKSIVVWLEEVARTPFGHQAKQLKAALKAANFKV